MAIFSEKSDFVSVLPTAELAIVSIFDPSQDSCNSFELILITR